MTRLGGLLAVVLLVTAALPSAQPPSRPTFGTRTSAVVVDAVLRDRQGRPITDLTIKDFEIYEDGVRQQIGALSMIAPDVPGVTDEKRRVYNTGISKETAAAGTERTAKEGDDVPGGQTIVAIMFGSLSPESREAALKASQAYLETPERPDDLALVPGRRTVIYFSDNLPLTVPGPVGGDGLRHRFDLLIGRANAANVSVYPVDAVGLRVHSQETANGVAMTNAAKSSLGSPDGSNGAAMAAGIEITQAGSTSHVFGRLAKETGGFVIENTNDLAAGFRRIDADRRFHYLLTYTPANADFGGEYRRIKVKVARRGAVVRARSGYRADRSLAVMPTLAYEAGPAAALTGSPLPSDIPIEARALRLPTRDAPGQLAMLVRVPASGLRFETDPVLGRYRTDAAVLVRIRDESGAVVRKASQPYRLDGPVDGQAAAAQGDLVVFRNPSLPPGRYMVEYAVHDALAGRAGAGTAPLDIPEPAASTLGAGDLIVVQRAEPVKAGDVEPNHPLLVGSDVLLYPNLGEPLAAGTPQTLTLYTTVRPAASHATLRASVSLVRDRQTLVTAPVLMAAPGPDGFIRQVVRLPLPALAPGSYTVRLDLSDGQNQTGRTARVVVK